jgi:hypothetical protein
LGNQYATFDRDTFTQVDTGYLPSESIERTDDTTIPRYAFLHESFSHVSGLIWSRRSIGSFVGRHHDFVFVHNVTAQNPLSTRWFSWSEEDLVKEIENERCELTIVRSDSNS